MSYAYSYTNLCTGLAASAFTWSGAGLNDATRSRLNDARMDKRYVHSASAANGLNVIIDFGGAVALTGFALLNGNCAVQKTDATAGIVAADDAAFTVNGVVAKAASTLNSAAPYNKDHVLQFIAVTRRYWKITFTWTGSVLNFALGELFAFNAQTQLSRKSIYGGGENEEIKSATVDFYNGGRRSYFLGGPIRSQVLPFSDLTAAQRAEQATLWRGVKGPTTPLLWIDSYEATAVAAAAAEQAVIYGTLDVPTFTWKEHDFALYNPGDLVIRSLGREIGA